MAIHNNKSSMMKESLQEMIEVARYCIDFEKHKDPRWETRFGCYGYPAALLLFSIVDAIGTEIMGGGDDMKRHFEILNHQDYYDMKLDSEVIEILRKEYRNRLSHNAHIGELVAMHPGSDTLEILQKLNGILLLNLKPFLELSEKAVDKFIIR